MNSHPLTVSLAILQQEEKFLLQLRDDLPHIRCPGQWTLFGGHLEPGEKPELGLKRELLEEIGYRVLTSNLFRCYTEDQILRYIYSVPLTVGLEELVLQEGQDMALVPPSAIRQGCFYSPKIQQIRSLSPFHQRVLLEYLENQSILTPRNS